MKTPFCGTLEACEKTSPCLFLDFDRGTMSLNKPPIPTIYTTDKWSDVGTIYTHMAKKDWSGLAKFIGSEQPKEYKSVVFDSGTELAGILLRSIVAEDDRNEGVPDQAAYFKTELRFFTMYRSFQTLPLSVVMTAGVKDQKDDVAGVVRLFPEFSPGLLHKLLRYTDLIMFMDVVQDKEKDIHQLRVRATNRFTARDRSGKLEPVMKGEFLYWNDIVKRILT